MKIQLWLLSTILALLLSCVLFVTSFKAVFVIYLLTPPVYMSFGAAFWFWQRGYAKELGEEIGAGWFFAMLFCWPVAGPVFVLAREKMSGWKKALLFLGVLAMFPLVNSALLVKFMAVTGRDAYRKEKAAADLLEEYFKGKDPASAQKVYSRYANDKTPPAAFYLAAYYAGQSVGKCDSFPELSKRLGAVENKTGYRIALAKRFLPGDITAPATRIYSEYIVCNACAAARELKTAEEMIASGAPGDLSVILSTAVTRYDEMAAAEPEYAAKLGRMAEKIVTKNMKAAEYIELAKKMIREMAPKIEPARALALRLRAEPAFAKAYKAYLDGKNSLRSGDQAAAARYFTRAMKESPDFGEPYLAQAVLSAKTGDSAGAVMLAEQAGKIFNERGSFTLRSKENALAGTHTLKYLSYSAESRIRQASPKKKIRATAMRYAKLAEEELRLTLSQDPAKEQRLDELIY